MGISNTQIEKLKVAKTVKELKEAQMEDRKEEVKVDLVENIDIFDLTLSVQVKVQARKRVGCDYEYTIELIHPWPTNAQETPEELFIASIRKRALDSVVNKLKK